MSISINIDIWV